MPTKTNHKQPTITPKLTHTDKALLNMTRAFPEDTAFAIGKRLQQAGIISDPVYANQLLKRKDYLRGEFEAIRQHNKEYMERRILPKALQIHEKVLRDKSISTQDKKEWVFQAEKGLHSSELPVAAPPTVNIESMQVLIKNILAADGSDVSGWNYYKVR